MAWEQFFSTKTYLYYTEVTATVRTSKSTTIFNIRNVFFQNDDIYLQPLDQMNLLH